VEQLPNLVAGQDGGDARRSDGANGIEPADVPFEDALVEEQQGREGLVLRTGGDAALDGEVGQEGLHFGRAHGVGVPDVVKANEPLCPIDVGLFGAVGVVLGAGGMANAVEQFHGVLPWQGLTGKRRVSQPRRSVRF
jgi:hypothetical protein